jgi:hypothetical protein
MPIINPLPYNIANGDPVDATPVTANFTQIVNDVNSGAAAVGGLASQEFFVAPTSNPAGAIPLLQAQQEFATLSGSAALNGNSGQVFNVATAVTNNEAVPYGQAQSQFAAITGSPVFQFAVAAPPANSVNAPQIAQTLGAGASAYTDQTASRAAGTVYTNTTGRPLVVLIDAYPINNGYTAFTNNGPITYASATGGAVTSPTIFFAIVPPGGNYVLINPGSINSWYEF